MEGKETIGHRVAVVTGAERGLGREIARRLGLEGITVVPTARDAKLAAVVAEEIVRTGGSAYPEELDVLDEPGIHRFAEGMGTMHGRVDILINNAGVCLDTVDSALDVDIAVLRETLETNLFGAWRLTSALVPLMLRNSYGRIVNVSSTMGQLESMGHTSPAYRLSKVALNALTCMLADELKGTGIIVNSADPGWIRTDMGGPGAPLSVEEGATELLRLAMLDSTAITGGFYHRGRLIPW